MEVKEGAEVKEVKEKNSTRVAALLTHGERGRLKAVETLMRRTIALLLMTVLFGAVLDTRAILIRHDRDDAKYLELAAKYPCVGSIGRMGHGTLVAPQWVLTAAHVAQAAKRRGLPIRFGGTDYAIADAVIHPEWRDGGPHDIALLRLEKPVAGIAPAEIYAAKDEAGKTVVFVGSGDTGTGLTGPVRGDGKMRAATNKVESADEQWLRFTFDEPATATDLEGISGPGDSGGPALLEQDGKLLVAGVSVWGSPGKNGRGTYGAGEGYTRVSSHRAWLMQVMAGK